MILATFFGFARFLWWRLVALIETSDAFGGTGGKVEPYQKSSSYLRKSPMMVCLRRSMARSVSLMPLMLGLVALPVVTPLLLEAQPAQAQSVSKRVLSVTGQGTEKIPTTLARINLGVQVEGKTAQQVQAEVARKSNAVVALLKSRNVDELQTAGISLNPNYDYVDNRQILKGYIGTNTVSFKVSTKDAGEILDDVIDAGATRIDGISFTATDAAIATAQKLALKKATEDAQAQAQAVLSALGFQSKEIIGIQVNGAAVPQPIMQQSADAFAVRSPMAKQSTPVVGGNQSVEGNVTLQITY
jgi:uncharacterized protein